jgi:hypothetical protein
MLGKDATPSRVRAALKKEWVVLWDSSRDELSVPAALSAQPQEVKDEWEKVYFEPARQASKRLRDSNTKAQAAITPVSATTGVGSNAAFAEELAAAVTDRA